MLVLRVLPLILILRASIPSHAGRITYEIYPEASCRMRGMEYECLTLSDVAKDIGKYFASNIILFLHMGNHILQGSVSASNIRNYALQGDTTSRSSQLIPTITCVNSSVFLNGTSLQIISLHFVHCSINLFNANAAIQNSKFENGKASNGGALAVFSSRVIFSGTSTFTGNMADMNEGYGGAIYANKSEIIFSGLSIFTHNKGHTGGAVCAVKGSSVTFNGTTTFMRNTAFEGGAVAAKNGDSFCSNNILFFSGNSSFVSNFAPLGGAVNLAQSTTLTMSQDASFANNTANVGAAVRTWGSSSLRFSGHITFANNKADYYGGALYGYNSSNFTFNGSTAFVGNLADEVGGAVDVRGGNRLSFFGNSSFVNNKATYDGGAVHAWKGNKLNFSGNCTIIGNEAAQGGAILLSSRSELSVNGGLKILNNTAVFGGGIAAKDSTIVSTGTFEVSGNEASEVSGNRASNGGGLYLQSSSIKIHGVGLFDGNVAATHDGYGGAVFALGSTVEFEGKIEVRNNTAGYGGGLALLGINDKALTFLLKAETHVNLVGNSAYKRGGAIFVEDNPFTFCTFDGTSQTFIQETCFLHLLREWYNCDPIIHNDHSIPVRVTVGNNTALQAGNILYGGYLKSCVVCAGPDTYFGSGSEIITKITEPHIDMFSEISSDPYKVCLCENDQPQCGEFETSTSITVYPGQVLFPSVVAIGQMNGMVPSVIRAVPVGLRNNSQFRITQPAESPKTCSELQYPLSSTLREGSLLLYSDEPCSTSGYPLTLNITFMDCPVGFTLSQQGNCICDTRLQQYTHNCSIQTLTISRQQDDSFWVGLDEQKLILHPHCPFDYCSEKPVSFKFNSTYVQCASGRSGVLCGACHSGYSLALGSSRCLSGCSNEYLALVLVFAFAGVVLVVFLFLCRLTIAEGTLSGLIFYANVIAVNHTVFFPSGEQNVLTVFIAWLNLDLGIETCFIEGLNAYYSTWLQFVFPIYIWLMVGVIIVVADRSTFFARIIGRTNPVAVLATLFLLSYTKLLRAIAAAFSFTTLDYPENSRKVVWLNDGNIGYLDRHDARHISLFLFSLLYFLFIFLPYTLLLLFGQWIQKKLWRLSPTKQLYVRSFLDAHYAPYKERHRYWTGLLLVLRFVMLFITTIINIHSPQDPFSNLLVILIVALPLTVWGWVIHGLYKKWYLDLLEVSFILNLLVLVGGTYQVRQSGGNQAALVYTSVSIVLVTFITIVVGAVMKQVRSKIIKYQQRSYEVTTNENMSQDDEESTQLVPDIAAAPDVIYSILEIDRNETSGEIELSPANLSTNS